jgi:2-amino-4-hydroxy-6-hydroxymethyldihydropteridine diphosphokinase
VTDAIVALGANLARPEQQIRRAVRRLARTPGLELRAASRLWRSEPWGLREQPEFVNAAVLLGSAVGPRELLALLQEEERRAGRRRGRRFGPRILDLDLLAYGNVVVAEPGLSLPHPAIPERTFVLEPLGEVAPEWRHPLTGRSAAELLADLRASGKATACEPIEGPALWPAVEELVCLG